MMTEISNLMSYLIQGTFITLLFKRMAGTNFKKKIELMVLILAIGVFAAYMYVTNLPSFVTGTQNAIANSLAFASSMPYSMLSSFSGQEIRPFVSLIMLEFVRYFIAVLLFSTIMYRFNKLRMTPAFVIATFSVLFTSITMGVSVGLAGTGTVAYLAPLLALALNVIIYKISLKENLTFVFSHWVGEFDFVFAFLLMAMSCGLCGVYITAFVSLEISLLSLCIFVLTGTSLTITLIQSLKGFDKTLLTGKMRQTVQDKYRILLDNEAMLSMNDFVMENFGVWIDKIGLLLTEQEQSLEQGDSTVADVEPLCAGDGRLEFLHDQMTLLAKKQAISEIREKMAAERINLAALRETISTQKERLSIEKESLLAKLSMM